MTTTKLVIALTMVALLAGGGGAARADEPEEEMDELAGENVVVRNEDVGCIDTCVDSFEVKCTQSSKFLCVTIIDNGSLDDPLIASYVGTLPTAILGQADIDAIPAGSSGGFCFTRPAAEGTMKGLVTVTAAAGAVSLYTYQLQAECITGAGVSRNTVVTRKQNQ